MEEPGEAGQRAERAPLASEEGMEVSPTLPSSAEKEIIGGNEFKVTKVYTSVFFDPITNMIISTTNIPSNSGWSSL